MFKKSLLFEIIKWNYTNYYYYYYRIEIFWRDIWIKIQRIFLPSHLHPTLFNRRVIFIIWMDSNKDKKFHGTWLIPTASIVSRLWKLEFYSWRKRAPQFHPYECNSDIREQLYSFISTVSSIVIYIYIYRPFENSNNIYPLYSSITYAVFNLEYSFTVKWKR